MRRPGPARPGAEARVRILYGVVGDGMGHATRSRVVLEHLLARGHDVRVVVSGRAHDFLQARLGSRPGITFHRIHGLHLVYDQNVLDKSRSVEVNAAEAPRGVTRNVGMYLTFLADGWEPRVVFSDYESWAYFYGLNHRLPVISIDNMQVINRCAHLDDVTDGRCLAFRLARAAVKVKQPGAWHYLVTSFFFPTVRRKRTTLIPPILRPEVLAARREPGEHVLVYQTAATNPGLLGTLARLPGSFRVYGMGGPETRGPVELRPFSEEGFIDDLRTARAVIANGGFSLMSEAVHLGVPVLSVPLEGQYEQELNARYLAKLGYGAFARTLTEDAAREFLDAVPDHAQALRTYPASDNRMLYACLDELLARVEAGRGRPNRLSSPHMGGYEGAG